MGTGVAGETQETARPRMPDAGGAEVGGIAGDRLRGFIERIERLHEERKALADDVKDVFAEANSAGFDVKAIKIVLRDRRLEPAELEHQETLVALYKRALGM